ncbi:MAG: hypothetical protein LBP88_01030, partial [Treponema sp.]|nr:hypothetical protein [Treponema sp.]
MKSQDVGLKSQDCEVKSQDFEAESQDCEVKSQDFGLGPPDFALFLQQKEVFLPPMRTAGGIWAGPADPRREPLELPKVCSRKGYGTGRPLHVPGLCAWTHANLTSRFVKYLPGSVYQEPPDGLSPRNFKKRAYFICIYR